jgi:hypothetical protein
MRRAWAHAGLPKEQHMEVSGAGYLRVQWNSGSHGRLEFSHPGRDTKADRTVKVVSLMRPDDPEVVSVQPLPRHRLLLQFSNGERRIFDAVDLLSKGVFQQLSDPAAFAAVRVVHGCLEWPGEIDLCYHTLYYGSTPVDGLKSSTAA